MLTRSFWYFQQLIQIETSFTMNSTMHRVGYSLGPGLVGEGRRSWALERQSHKDTRDGFSVASVHPGWAQSGLGWQLLMYFKGREESQRIRDAKTGNETKLTDHFPLLTVLSTGQTPNKAWAWVPGCGLGTLKANHSINYQKTKKLVTKAFTLKTECTRWPHSGKKEHPAAVT